MCTNYVTFLSLSFFLVVATGAVAGDDFATEEVVLQDGTKLTVLRMNDRILGITSEDEFFQTEEQVVSKYLHKPYNLKNVDNHYPATLEKMPPFKTLPDEVKSRLEAWKIVDDAGNVMDTIFCTEQGCSVGGYNWVADKNKGG
jgi:hypothetical protein